MSRHIRLLAMGLLVACLAPEVQGAESCISTPGGVIGWWPGDGDSRDACSTNHGILSGGATANAVGRVLSGFSFSGTNAFVQIPDSPLLRPTNFTVEGWVRFTSLDSPGTAPVGRQYIVFRQNTRSGGFEGFVLNKDRVSGTDYFVFGVTSATGQEVEIRGTVPISVNTWYHIAGVRGSNYLQLYVNGQLQGQASVTFPQDYGNQPLYFGSSGQVFWDRKLAGLLDEVALYSRPLSSNEVASIYLAGGAGRCKQIVIFEQPTGQMVVQGTNVVFSVSAGGFNPISYQWLFNGSAISGATASSYALANVDSSNGGNYSVVLSNSFGTVASSSAALTVVSPPTITLQPQSRTNLLGTTATFSVAAAGTDLAYSWSKDGSVIPWANQSSLEITNVMEYHAGTYSVTVSNWAGAVTRSASLTVWVPPQILAGPGDIEVQQGDTLNLSVSVFGTAPLRFQWRLNGVDLLGATQSVYSRTNLQLADAGAYAVVITNVAGSTNALANVTVKPLLPVITVQPQSQSVSIGSAVAMRVTATGPGPLRYQWFKNGIGLEGETGPTLYLEAVSEFDAADYYVRVSNDLGGVSSPPATLTVVSHPVITRQPTSKTEYPRTNAFFISSAQGLGLKYYWQKNGTNLLDGPKVSGANTPVLQVSGLSALDAGNYRLVVTNAAGSAISQVAILSVLDPYIITQPENLLRTVGAYVCLTVAAQGSSALSYQWRRGNANLTDGGHISGARSSDLRFDGILASDAGSYSVVVSHSSGAITSAVVTVQVVDHVIFGDERLSNAVRCALAPATIGNQLWPSNLLGLKCLSAPNLGITRVSGLELAPNIQQLSLSGNEIVDIRHLRRLTQLETLDLSRNRIHDIETLRDLTNLTCLALGQNEITNYAALSSLSRLIQLNVRAGGMMTLDSLKPLHQLRSLSLWENGIEDVSPLTALTNLTCLDLRYNAIPNPEPAILNATNLTSLYLAGNPITNLPSLAGLQSLHLLNVDECYLEDITPVADLPNLRYLSASRNPVTDFSPLAELNNLQGIELRGNKLQQVDFLSSLPALTFADLAYNELSSVAPFIGRTNLGLVLDGNPSLNTAALPGLSGLTYLWLNGNGLTNLNFLASLPQLTALGLEENGIENFAPLSSLRHLRLLALSGNSAADYSFLGMFTNLTSLKLDHGRVSDLSFLGALTNLQFLSANRNLITDLAPLTELSKLYSFYADRNRITESQVGLLLSLPSLRHTDMRHNLLSADSEVLDLLACQRVGRLFCGCSPSTNDPALPACGTIEVAWLPQNRPPRLDAPPIHYLPSGQSGWFKVKVWDEVVWDSEISLEAMSFNPGLIPNEGLYVTGTNENRVVTMASAPAAGVASILVSAVNEAGLTASSEVLVKVLPAIPLANMTCAGQTLDPDFASSLADATEETTAVTSVDLLNLTELSLHGNPAGFCGWTWLTNVQRLTLNGGSFTNLNFLTNFSGLTSLDLNDARDAGLATLPVLGTLTNLVLTGHGVTSLGFVSQIPGLQALTVINSGVTDFSPLQALPALTTISLIGNNITDIRFLTDMPQLLEVSLNSNRLRDISPLAALPLLETLSLQDNYLADAAPLLNSRFLRYCDLVLNVLDFNEPVNSSVYRALSGSGATVKNRPQRTPPNIDVRTNWFVSVFADSSITFRVDDAFARDDFTVGITSSDSNLVSNPRVSRAAWPYWNLDISAGGPGNSPFLTLSATNDAGLYSATRIAVSVGPFFSLNGSGILDSPKLVWPSIEPKPWFGQSWFSHDNIAAAQSGSAGDFQTSYLATAVGGPGTLDFWWRVSSETNYDWLQFQVNGVTWTQISGEVSWRRETFWLPQGSNTLAWVYGKDRDNSFGFDAGWVDQVTFTPALQVGIMPDPANERILLTVFGPSSANYFLQSSTNLVNWLDRFSITLTNGPITVPYTNGSQGQEFFRLRQAGATSKLPAWSDGTAHPEPQPPFRQLPPAPVLLAHSGRLSPLWARSSNGLPPR